MKTLITFLISLTTIITFGATYTTKPGGNGQWHSSTNWTCNCIPPIGSNHIYIIEDNIKVNSFSVGGNGSLTIKDNATLEIAVTDFTETWGAFALIIESGSKLKVKRDVNLNGSGNSNHIINGTIETQNGDIALGGSNTTITGDATLITKNITTDGTVNLGNVNIDIDNNFVVENITIASGIIDIGNNLTTSGNYTFKTTGNTDINIGGDLQSIAGGTIDIAMGTLDIIGNFEISGSGGATVGADTNIGTDLLVNNSGAVVFSNTLTVGNDIKLDNGSSKLTLNGNTAVSGNITGTGGSAKLTIGANVSASTVSLTGGNPRIEGNNGGVLTFSSLNSANDNDFHCSSGTNYDNGTNGAPASPFDFQTCDMALPVSYTYFNHSCNTNTLNWQTAQEENNDYFEVEGSNDLTSYKTIGKIEGNGTTTFTQTYSYTIESEEFQYYRLRQVDYNEEYEYSKVTVNKCYIPTTSSTYIFPTIGRNDFYLNHTFSGDTEEVHVNIYSLTGQLLVSKLYDITNIDESINLADLSEGAYLAKISTNTFNKSVKIIKK